MTALKQKNYALPIAMMIVLFGMISFVTGLANPMGVIVKDQFGASNFMSQLGNFANFIAYAFMGIPAGLLLQKIGYKKTALLAIMVGLGGVTVQYLSGISGSFAIYLLGAFVSGFSMCMLNTVVNPMLNTLGRGGKRGNQLIQIGGTFSAISATVVPVLVGYFIGNSLRPAIQDANPALFIAMGVFTLVFVMLFFVHIPEPHLLKGASNKKDKHSPLSFRHFVLGAIAIFIYVGIEVGIPNISNIYMTTKTTEQLADFEQEYFKQQSNPSYLNQLKQEAALAIAEAEKTETKHHAESKAKIAIAKQAQNRIITTADYEKNKDTKITGLGIDPAIAGTVVGTYWFLMLIGRFWGASLGSKFSSKKMLAFVSILGMLFILIAIWAPISTTVSMPVFKSDISFGLVQVPIGLMFLVLCGLCTSVMWGGIFNLAVEGLGKYVPAASGIFMVMVCGGGILPLFQGFVADTVSYMASYWVVFAGLVFILYYTFVGSKNVNKNIPVE